MKRFEDMALPELMKVMSIFAEAIQLAAGEMAVERPLFAMVLLNQSRKGYYITNVNPDAAVQGLRVAADRIEGQEDDRMLVITTEGDPS